MSVHTDWLSTESPYLLDVYTVIKNLFWCIHNLNNDFISLELITLERENTKEAKIFDSKDVFETNGKGPKVGTSCRSV